MGRLTSIKEGLVSEGAYVVKHLGESLERIALDS